MALSPGRRARSGCKVEDCPHKTRTRCRTLVFRPLGAGTVHLRSNYRSSSTSNTAPCKSATFHTTPHVAATSAQCMWPISLIVAGRRQEQLLHMAWHRPKITWAHEARQSSVATGAVTNLRSSALETFAEEQTAACYLRSCLQAEIKERYKYSSKKKLRECNIACAGSTNLICLRIS